jgi:hypothetical protein
MLYAPFKVCPLHKFRFGSNPNIGKEQREFHRECAIEKRKELCPFLVFEAAKGVTYPVG